MSLKSVLQGGLRVWRRKHVKNILIVVVLALTAVLFIRFFTEHPEYWQQFKEVSPWWIVAVVALNIPMIGLLLLIYNACLALCRKHLEWKENFFLTSYSSIANFFGPLQSGPGVRAAYLKSRHQVRLRDYTLATLLYYGLFAAFSGLFLLIGNRPWWQTLLAVLVIAVGSGLFIRWFQRRDSRAKESQFHLRGKILLALVVVTFLQVVLTAITYFVELRAVNPDISIGQAVSYTGAANFALFVSLTPDAIGIREAFLVFSQHLHHVSTADILSANLIDRASYAIFLGLLFLVVLATHAKDKLSLSSLKRGN